MRLKWFLVASSVLAAIALVGPWVFDYRGPFANVYLDSDAISVALWSVAGCFFLLVVSLYLFRFRGLWLAIPLIVALISPTVIAEEFGASLAAAHP